MRKKEILVTILFIFMGGIIISPLPYIGLTCSSDNPKGYCYNTNRVLKWNTSILKKLIHKNNLRDFPEFGYTTDFSWVSGNINYYELEGGCYYLDFDNNPPKWEGNNLPYGGRLALEKEQILFFNLEDKLKVVLFGKLGKSYFSMACPNQHYFIEKVIKR